MSEIIRSELFKFYKSKKNLIIILLFFAYLFSINLYSLNQYKGYMSEEHSTHQNKRVQAGGFLAQSTKRYEKDEKLTDEEREKLRDEIEFYRVERNKLMLMEFGYKEDIKEKYNYILMAENDRYKNIINGLDSGIITEAFLNGKNMTTNDMQKKMILNQYILDNEIQPILNPYTMTGANSLVMFLEGNNLLILIFFIALLSVDIYLSEVEEGSYKSLYSQPFKRNQIFIGKIITITTISLLLIILGVILNFVIISMINGMGNMSYPIMTTENIFSLSLSKNPGEFAIIPLWQYVIMGFGLLLPILFSTIALIIFISIFSDSSTKTLGISMMLLVMAFIFNNFISKQSIVNLFYPYCYLYVRDVIEVNNRSNYMFGILLNSLMTIGLFIMSYGRFVSKDFLGAKS